MPTYCPTENDPLLARIQAGRIEEASAFLNQGNYDTLNMEINTFLRDMNRDVKSRFMANLGKSLQATDVVVLNLAVANIDDAEAVALAEALPAGLQSLSLGWNQISAAGVVEVVKALPAGLQSLHLGGNAIGAAAVEVVKALRVGLQSLDLRFNAIGAAAVEVVKALPAGLQSLHLEGNEIGAAAVEVVKVLPEDLQSLDLGFNFIDNQSELTLVDALQKSGSTCSVCVFGNLMSDSMTARMRAVAFENALEKHRRAPLEGAGLAQMLTQLNKTLDAAHQKFLPNEVVLRIGESKYLNNGLLYLRGFMEESKKIERETAAAAAAAARRASLRSATRIKLT